MRHRYLLLVALILTACTERQIPTPTPQINREPSLQPSATVLPFISTDSPDISIGRSEPTSAALAAEGQPSQEAPIPPEPTQGVIPLQFILDDGGVSQVLFYGAPTKPAPYLILLHDEGQTSTDWEILPTLLQNAGYNVFIPSLPGQPTVADVVVIEENIRLFSNTVVNTMIIIGAGTGANIALAACAELSSCIGVIAVSPRDNAPSLSTKQLLLVSADDDTIGTVQAERLRTDDWLRYSSGGRGLTLLDNQPDLSQSIIIWIQNYLPVP